MKKWLAILFLFSLGAVFFYYKDLIIPAEKIVTVNPKRLFKNSYNFTPGERLVFDNQEEFNPKNGRVFGMLVWLKFKDISQTNQRTFVLRKFDDSSKTGYALAFNQFNDGFYPQIFWSNQPETNWLTFQKFKPQINRWYGFLITFTEDRYLGLHLLRPNRGGTVNLENLGGYALPDVIPGNSAKLEIGSIATRIFNGFIARASFFDLDAKNFSLIDFTQELQSTVPLEALAKYPSYDLELRKKKNK